MRVSKYLLPLQEAGAAVKHLQPRRERPVFPAGGGNEDVQPPLADKIRPRAYSILSSLKTSLHELTK